MLEAAQYVDSSSTTVTMMLCTASYIIDAMAPFPCAALDQA
jgi:hypothetical protein